MKFIVTSVAAIAMICCAANTASAGCNHNQVYSSSMGQCIPKAAMCNANEVYSSSLGQCMPRTGPCDAQHVFRGGRCVWR